MAEDKDRNEMDKGFVVRDKRFSAPKEDSLDSKGESSKEEVRKGEFREGKFGEEEATGQKVPLPEINFPNFLLSLHTSALIQMGEIEDPGAKEPLMNLPLAKQTIDLIAMLGQKTKGNLTAEEERMMEAILYELRMRYVKKAG